jgi:hypothetical protein
VFFGNKKSKRYQPFDHFIYLFLINSILFGPKFALKHLWFINKYFVNMPMFQSWLVKLLVVGSYFQSCMLGCHAAISSRISVKKCTHTHLILFSPKFWLVSRKPNYLLGINLTKKWKLQNVTSKLIMLRNWGSIAIFQINHFLGSFFALKHTFRFLLCRIIWQTIKGCRKMDKNSSCFFSIEFCLDVPRLL